MAKKDGKNWVASLFKNFEEILGSLILVSIISVMFLEVVFRYFFRHPFLWTDEYTRLALIWMTFIGMVIGVKKGSHITIDFLLKMFPLPWQTFLRIAMKIIFVGFCILMILNGFQLTKLKFGIPTPALEWSWGLFYLPLVVSGGLIIFWTLLSLYKKNLERQPCEEEGRITSIE